MVFPNIPHWNMIFLFSSRKMILLLPENMILFFVRKINVLSQKNTWKYDIFFKCSEQMVFPKKIALEYNLSCTIREEDISFSRKYEIFSIEGKWKMIFVKKKYIEISCSLYIRKTWCFLFLQMWCYPYVKKAKMTLSRKVHLEMTFPASLKKIILILENMILEF